MGLEERLFPKQLLKNMRSRVENGIKSLRNRTSEYVEAGIDGIRKKVEIAKKVIPYELMYTLSFSSSYGRMGYYSAKALISYQTVKQAKKGKIYYGGSNNIVPLIAGIIGSALGFGAAILLGDFNSLNHHYQELQLEDQQLAQELNATKIEVNNLQNEISTNNNITQLSEEYHNITQILNYLQNEISTDNNNISQLSQDYQNITQQVNTIGIKINYLQNEISTDNNNITQLSEEYQQLVQQIKTIETEIQNLENQIQNLTNQVQNENTLEKILFGNNNSYDMSVIQVNSVQIENGTAYIQGTTYSGSNVILEIPLSYVENSNVNIQEFVNNVQQNNLNAYIAIDRADLQYMNLLNNQNNTPVIAIQPNQPVNIGVMASTDNTSNIDYLLNHLGQYNIVIQDGNNVYNDPNALWGYISNSSVIVNFQNSYQYQLAENMINIADQIINSPGNQNPTGSGYIDTYSIFQGTLTINTNQGYPQYNVGQTYIPLIVLKSGQGNTIINEVSS